MKRYCVETLGNNSKTLLLQALEGWAFVALCSDGHLHSWLVGGAKAACREPAPDGGLAPRSADPKLFRLSFFLLASAQAQTNNVDLVDQTTWFAILWPVGQKHYVQSLAICIWPALEYCVFVKNHDIPTTKKDSPTKAPQRPHKKKDIPTNAPRNSTTFS